jgi:hypothetical protein
MLMEGVAGAKNADGHDAVWNCGYKVSAAHSDGWKSCRCWIDIVGSVTVRGGLMDDPVECHFPPLPHFDLAPLPHGHFRLSFHHCPMPQIWTASPSRPSFLSIRIIRS